MKAFSLFALIAIQSYALQVYPIPVELKDGKKLVEFQIADDHGKYQAAVQRWTQDSNGTDILSDTSDIVVYPRVFEAPKKLKVYQKNANLNGSSYRLILKELAVSDDNVTTGTKIKKTLSIPIFVVPEGSKATVTNECSNNRLNITNTGQLPVKILNIDGKKLSEYLFPSRKKEVIVEGKSGVVETDRGKFEYRCTIVK